MRLDYLTVSDITLSLSDQVEIYLQNVNETNRIELADAIETMIIKMYKMFENLTFDCFVEKDTIRKLFYLSGQRCWCRVGDYSIGFSICAKTLHFNILDIESSKFINNFEILDLPDV